ncbi:MAG TPA: hypothetical protein VG497_33955 [Kribbella sp.]|nr:hypothetical protein [Kribbella sp.]
MSHDDATAMLKVAKAVRDDFGRMRPKAENLTQITSPADEPTSNGYNQRLVSQGEPKGVFVTGKERTDEAYTYADELVKRLEKALGIIGSSDEQAASDVKNAGKQSGGFA